MARQLRAATQYKDIRVLDTLPLRTQEGKRADQSSQVPGLSNVPGQSATVKVLLHPEAIVRKDQDRYVRFDRVIVTFRIPYTVGLLPKDSQFVSTQYQFREVGLETAGDFKEGQKTVLGKVSGTDDESALFIVVSLKVLD